MRAESAVQVQPNALQELLERHFSEDELRRMTFDQLTPSQNASRVANTPSGCPSRAAITASTAPTPTLRTAPIANRIASDPSSCRSTPNSTPERLTSGGRIAMSQRRHSAMLITVFSLVPISVDISAAMNCTGYRAFR